MLFEPCPDSRRGFWRWQAVDDVLEKLIGQLALLIVDFVVAIFLFLYRHGWEV